MAEKIYSRIMDATALYSFKPRENYRLVIYKDKDEFTRKTGQPEWSGGLNTGREIFSYEQPGLAMVLAHETTHLIFSEYLEGQVKSLRWLNEGLAQNIEILFHPIATPDSMRDEWRSEIRKTKLMSLEEIMAMNPYRASESRVALWYKTSASLTGYLLERGGTFNFSLFLKSLKMGRGLNEALTSAYPGKFKSWEGLYSAWASEMGR